MTDYERDYDAPNHFDKRSHRKMMAAARARIRGAKYVYIKMMMPHDVVWQRSQKADVLAVLNTACRYCGDGEGQSTLGALVEVEGEGDEAYVTFYDTERDGVDYWEREN